MTNDESRSYFEQWISDMPYNGNIDRLPDYNEDKWSGQYIAHDVQLAWEAWQAALVVARETK